MRNEPINPDATRKELPRRLTEKQIRSLVADEFYSAAVYLAAFGFRAAKVALEDYEKGTIDPSEVTFDGEYTPFRQRGPGQRAGMRIRGREIQRLRRELRQPGRYFNAMLKRHEAAREEVAV
ncbi:MAG: hypothetical protein ACLFUF_08615 [Opitutales bacterium]